MFVEGVGKYRRLGSTIDDAAGEAFDKTAKLLGLSGAGGPAVEREALGGNPAAIDLPRPLPQHIGIITPYAAQVQGVWVPPDRRGEGLATRGMAAVVEAVRRDIAPVVSLYVNEWNGPARAAYERVGFSETARFATIMF